MTLKTNRILGIMGAIGSLSLLTGLTPPPLAATSSERPAFSISPQGLIANTVTTAMLKVGSLSELKSDKTCDGTGGVLVYAETKSYRIYICGDRKDRTQPRYYRSRERAGKGKLDIEAKGYNPRQMRYFEFRNNGYAYLLQMPMSQIPQPELTVLSPQETPLLREKVTRYLARP
jgi:hypothetical protein